LRERERKREKESERKKCSEPEGQTRSKLGASRVKERETFFWLAQAEADRVTGFGRILAIAVFCFCFGQ
jgi:hypothetical protein